MMQPTITDELRRLEAEFREARATYQAIPGRDARSPDTHPDEHIRLDIAEIQALNRLSAAKAAYQDAVRQAAAAMEPF